MPRALWSGSISFGLVNVPVRLVTAVREKKVSFHLMSPDGKCRLRQKLYCPDTGKEYEQQQAAHGYEVSHDHYILISDDELNEMRPDGGRTIELIQFVDLASVDPLYFDQPYLLTPGEGGTAAYHLLTDAMKKSKRVGIARFIMRQREHVAVIRTLALGKGKAKIDALMLHTMHYHEEVVALSEPPELSLGEEKTPAKQSQVAKQLIDAMTGSFDPAEFEDEYRKQLESLIRSKAEGHEVKHVAAGQEPPPKTYNLMEALKESVEQRKTQRKKTG